MAKIVFEEDAEIIVPESTRKPENDDIFDESSDDEAPEAISTSKAKENLISREQAEKEASAKLAASEKEKRRQRDQLLKEQKEGSKRQAKELEKKAKKEKLEKQYHEKMEKRKLKQQDKIEETDKLLPTHLLQQALIEEEEESKKRKHVTTEEFEKMLAEQEQEEKKRSKKRKSIKEGRNVGEYTVKVLNHRPKLQRANTNILNMRKLHMHRSAVPRKEAVVNISSGRDGAALVFHRK